MSITLDELYDLADKYDITIIETPLNDQHCGYYDDQTRTILLDSTMNDRQKRCTLAHELIHAKYHDTGHNKRDEKRCIRETALWLINEHDYAQAEQEYEGNGYNMALTLNITMQTLDDYQHILEQA